MCVSVSVSVSVSVRLGVSVSVRLNAICLTVARFQHLNTHFQLGSKSAVPAARAR